MVDEVSGNHCVQPSNWGRGRDDRLSRAERVAIFSVLGSDLGRASVGVDGIFRGRVVALSFGYFTRA